MFAANAALPKCFRKVKRPLSAVSGTGTVDDPSKRLELQQCPTSERMLQAHASLGWALLPASFDRRMLLIGLDKSFVAV